MDYCHNCKVNVPHQSHWKSKYLNANYCFKCCKEKDLATLPNIVKRLIKIKKNYASYDVEKYSIIENDDTCTQLMSVLHRSNSELAIDTLRQRVCFLQIQNTIKNKEELMTWNKIISNQLLQTDGYVEFYEIDKIKSFFANYSRGLDDALDQMSCMQI